MNDCIVFFDSRYSLRLRYMYTEGDDDNSYDDYDYDVNRHSSITSLSRQLLSSSSSSAADADIARQWRTGRRDGGASTWRWCYVCSGKLPDRQCELFPQYVTLGPSKVNCTKNYCTAYIRYEPKDYFIERDRNGKLGTRRPYKNMILIV